MNHQQEEIKNLENIISKLQKRKYAFKSEIIGVDNFGKRLDYQKEIDRCEAEIQESLQKIELLKSQYQQDNLIIWNKLSQKIQHIPIQDETIESLTTRHATETVVDFHWKESVIFLLTKLRQTFSKKEDSRTVSTDYVINRLLRLDKSKEQSRALALFALEYLAEEAEENELEDKTVELIINNAIKNLDKNDGSYP